MFSRISKFKTEPKLNHSALIKMMPYAIRRREVQLNLKITFQYRIHTNKIKIFKSIVYN